MRLDRFVSQSTGNSRREARMLIRQGRLEVDGRIVREVASEVGTQSVCLDGEALGLPGPLYLMLNKPVGVISATRDGRHATVSDLLPSAFAQRVHPVGRLDKDTSGLLFLTDDGAWSHRVTSPHHACPKVYRATLAAPLRAESEARLASGLVLRGESRPTKPAVLERLSDREVRVIVTEGRYHLVRRLFAALDNRVVGLHRERIGGVCLDAALAVGAWRPLSDTERDSVLDPSGVG